MKCSMKLIAGIFPLIFWVTSAAFAQPVQKVCPFSDLTGPYSVGTTQFSWVDPNRHEAYSSNPKRNRTVVVQVWYPTVKTGSRPDAPYLLSPQEFSVSNSDTDLLKTFNQFVQTRSFLNAPAASGNKSFPVIVFHPGGGMNRFTSSFITEQMASQGYVVFAVEQYGYNKSTNYPDGTSLDLDLAPDFNNPEFQQKIDDGTASVDEIYQGIRADWNQRGTLVFPVQLADDSFVLGKIAELNNIKPTPSYPSFVSRLDLSRIGSMGWSQGGAVAVNRLVNDPRIKATVDLDGMFMGPGKEGFKTDKPFMLLHSQLYHGHNSNLEAAESRLQKLTQSWDEHMMLASTGPRFTADIRDSDHGNFSDYLLFLGFREPDKRQHAQELEQLIVRLTVSFFNTYLAGKPDAIPMNDPLIVNGRTLGTKQLTVATASGAES